MNKHSQVATGLWTIRLSEAYWFAGKLAYALTYEPVSMVYFTYIVLSWLGHDWRFGVCNNEKVTWLWPMSMTAPRFIDHVASQFIFSVRHEGVAHSCCEEIFRISCRPRSAFRDSGWPRAREISLKLSVPKYWKSTFTVIILKMLNYWIWIVVRILWKFNKNLQKACLEPN